MSTIPKLTMMGLYNYDNALFDEMLLPEGIVKADLINVFLLNYGEYPVIYPRWDTMKFALGVWSKKWYHSIERIITAMTEDYNPLHNFDRHELYTDTEGIDRTNTARTEGSTTTETSNDATETTTASNTTSAETENTISAYNEDTYQPDNKSNTNGSETSSGTRTNNATTSLETNDLVNQTGTDNTDRELQHEGHLYGNIGVTESTAMLQHELDLRSAQNILDIVSEMLFKEVCIFTY